MMLVQAWKWVFACGRTWGEPDPIKRQTVLQPHGMCPYTSDPNEAHWLQGQQLQGPQLADQEGIAWSTLWLSYFFVVSPSFFSFSFLPLLCVFCKNKNLPRLVAPDSLGKLTTKLTSRGPMVSPAKQAECGKHSSPAERDGTLLLSKKSHRAKPKMFPQEYSNLCIGLAQCEHDTRNTAPEMQVFCCSHTRNTVIRRVTF